MTSQQKKDVRNSLDVKAGAIESEDGLSTGTDRSFSDGGAEQSLERVLNTSTEEIHVSDVSSDEDEEETPRGKQGRLPNIYSSGTDASLESLLGSTTEEHITEAKASLHRMPTPTMSGSTTQSTIQVFPVTATKRSLLDDMDMEQHDVPLHAEQLQDSDSMDFKMPPQDRSVASKISASAFSTTSSNITPLQSYLNQPIVSPPFSLRSPAGKRSQAARAPSTDSKASSRSKRIMSPPKVKTTTSGRKSVSNHSNNRSSLYEMKKDIEELTAQFEAMERESQQRRAQFDLDPEDKFDESLGVMSQRADAMADALSRNYTRMRNMHSHNSLSDEENHKPDSANTSTHTPREKIQKTPEMLLRELDPSDNYVKREYPPVPKTPGTMFTTELAEVMTLDVGDHAYLSEIMDRQWSTMNDYRA